MVRIFYSIKKRRSEYAKDSYKFGKFDEVEVEWQTARVLKRGECMYILYTEEMKRLKEIFKPYEKGVELIEAAPKEAVEAFNKFYRIFAEITKDE